jgi:glycosyltransferase involved in cell wall biosynthesis
VDSVIQEGDMEWVELLGHTDPALLPDLISQSNIFIFASSCENMPNSLVEAMAVGPPIACSNRGPMPEVLCDGGLYFDPENHHSIASCVERIISDEDLREHIAIRAKFLAQRYSWGRCRDETFSNLIATLQQT